MRLLTRRRGALLLAAVLAVLGWASARARSGGPVADGLLRAVERPLELGAALGSGAADLLRDVFRRDHLSRRVRELELAVARLERERSELVEAARETARLAELAGLQAQIPAETRPARVIAAEASGNLRSVLIDAGARDGVRRDAAVVASGGLVGRVVRTGETTAVVQTLLDATSAVAVLDERSRVQGVLGGTGGEDCRLRYVPNLEDVKPGDVLIASGLDGIYPKGTRVGTIVEVQPGRDAFKDVRVRPTVAIRRLETVLVFVTPEAAERPAGGRERLALARPAPRPPGRR